MEDRFTKAEEFVKSENYTDLGWQNGWNDNPQIVKDCHKNHICDSKLKFDIQGNQRGSKNIVYCTQCTYYYKYDCSD